MTVNRIAYLTMAVTGLLYASGLGFAQTATTTPPHVPWHRRQSGSQRMQNRRSCRR